MLPETMHGHRERADQNIVGACEIKLSVNLEEQVGVHRPDISFNAV
jgi:hypothetical protein